MTQLYPQNYDHGFQKPKPKTAGLGSFQAPPRTHLRPDTRPRHDPRIGKLQLDRAAGGGRGWAPTSYFPGRTIQRVWGKEELQEGGGRAEPSRQSWKRVLVTVPCYSGVLEGSSQAFTSAVLPSASIEGLPNPISPLASVADILPCG